MNVDTPQSTLAEQAFEQIFDLILTGELPLGGIVNEANLAQRFSISRGPVREAVQRLQGLRLVTREPYMRARVVQLSGRDLVEIFQLRQGVEGMACRLASEAMSDTDLQQLLDDLEQSRNGQGATPEILDIHVRIAKGSGNKRIVSLLCGDLYHLMRIYRFRSGSEPGRRGKAFEEHWQIVRAMRSRDPDLAESLMRAHIGRATETLLASLNDIEAPLRLVTET
ncbi:GntR family transcriptional regulator [Limibacillus halophilus]|uniref:DNA-binding GntR family transcriptional regulator n=1 Tax=Limibacillus halophilus TaxID=1579333 RepID=A0A839SUX9_9PROT|nr:GntR family transcriptional regulator [Limibacillus halophilus]MBB3066128.1 DNA-binding GntR family transcriptional regulator [Limibacillus halophilus]